MKAKFLVIIFRIFVNVCISDSKDKEGKRERGEGHDQKLPNVRVGEGEGGV